MSLSEFLMKNGFFLDEKVARLIESVLHLHHQSKAFLLRGPPGSGKTHLTSLIARFVKAEYVFYQCTGGTSEEDLLYKYVPSETARSGIRITFGPLPRALIQSQKGAVVLTLDEFDKTRPSADALLLDFLQNCRLSLYIDDELTVVKGNPQNLVVFLTSNDFREFSEPLIRRLTVITLQLLKPDIVYRILSERFSEDVAMLLTQVYEDTVNAGCRKPATIPELLELGELMTRYPDLDFEKLLRSMILKYDDDWRRYVDYLRFRKPFQFSPLDRIAAEESIAKFYEPEQPPALIYSEGPERKDATVGEVLQKLRVPVKFEETRAEQVTEEKEVFMILEDKDKEAYTAVVKNLKPTPTDRPDEFGKFKLYFEDDKVFVTSLTPLTIAELKKLKYVRGEYYAESVYSFVDVKYIFDYLLSECTKVEYYTTNKVRVSFHRIWRDAQNREIKDVVVVEAEVIERFPPSPYGNVVLRYYVNGQPTMVIEPRRPIAPSDSAWSIQKAKPLAQTIYEFARQVPIGLRIVSISHHDALSYRLDDEECPTRIDIKISKDVAESLHVSVTDDREAVLRFLEEVAKL
jgi:energy-coupling factor transporter ATP-binding protein EcfA2